MKPLSKPLQEAFDALWKAYPHPPRDPKAAARDLFARRFHEVAEPMALARAAGAYAAACRRDKLDPAFIPHLRTWLSQRRHEDFLEAGTPAPEAADADHPLAALKAEVSEGEWLSWIAPLRVETGPDGTVVLARTGFAKGHVKARFGALIETVLGPVGWAVEVKEAR